MCGISTSPARRWPRPPRSRCAAAAARGNAGRSSRPGGLAASTGDTSGANPVRTGAQDVHLPPVALPDTARTLEDSPVEIDLLANDRACDGLQIVAVTAPGHGTTTLLHGKVRYAPVRGYRGLDAFTYTVAGEGGRSAKARVTVGVQRAHRSVVRRLDSRRP